jgi:hypothetical protein
VAVGSGIGSGIGVRNRCQFILLPRERNRCQFILLPRERNRCQFILLPNGDNQDQNQFVLSPRASAPERASGGRWGDKMN